MSALCHVLTGEAVAASERTVLASVIETNGADLPPTVARLLDHAPDSFGDARLGAIAVAIGRLCTEGRGVTPALLLPALANDRTGAALALGGLGAGLPLDLAEIEAETVWGAYQIRLAGSVGADLSAALRADPHQAASIIRAARKTLESLVLDSGTKALPTPLTWETLRQPVDYIDNLLGDRFLERGQGLILYGPAGCGKSVAGLQAVAEWAAGLDGLHIVPARALKTVVLQTEDSLNDTRESLKGILASSVFTPERLLLVEQNLIILPPVPGGTGRGLADLLQAASRAHKPDLLHVNPLLAFCPGDPARELGGLLYQFVDPVLKENRVGFLGVHHTPKTNNRDTSGYGTHDHQYLAAGDARVANWPRAMIQIEPVAKGVYRFRASKRGQRLGWTWDREPTTERYFRHAVGEVRWVDATPEDAQEAEAVESYRTIATVLPLAGEDGISRERIRQLAKETLKIGKAKADDWLKLAVEDRLVERIETLGETNRKVALFRLAEAAK